MEVRQIQMDTLGIISDSLVNSFGPKGSYTAIVKNMDERGVNISIEYTKDGYTIVKNILFTNAIERSVQELLTTLTLQIVKGVGDGTTSAIILCKTIFDALCEYEVDTNTYPADIVRHFGNLVGEIKNYILSKSKECTIEDIYDIALISTNGNTEIAETIRKIYEKYGLDVMIDVGVSTEVDNIVKEYDGMVLETGFTDICFINDKEHNTASVRNPKIYCFNDPIDTPEMLSLLDNILYNNILRCYSPGSVYEPIPTVIFGKSLSPDTSSYFETVVELMNKYPGEIPLLMVTDIHQDYLYEDIAKMCGAPFIKKYLNLDLQKADIEKGLAPTAETILDFCGKADLVTSDQLKTKIINPAKMFNEDGTYSDEYNMMLSYLETQVQKLKNDDAGIEQIARAKRRLYSFKGNMIDFLVGGISLADRNNIKASVEDAVLNCRSAARNGVGYGANFMAYDAIWHLSRNRKPDKTNEFFNVLLRAYTNLLNILYGYIGDQNEIDRVIQTSIRKGCPMNIRTGEYDFKVKSSIESDIVILESIAKIMTLMFTCNQYLVQTPMHNMYVDAK